MELNADEIVARDGRGQRRAVIGRREHMPRLGRRQMVGVDEIGVQPRLAGRDAGKDRVLAGERGMPPLLRRARGGAVFWARPAVRGVGQDVPAN